MKFKVTKSFVYLGEGSSHFNPRHEYTTETDVKEEVLKDWVEVGLAVILEEEVKEDIAEESEVVKEKKPRKTKKKAE